MDDATHASGIGIKQHGSMVWEKDAKSWGQTDPNSIYSFIL